MPKSTFTYEFYCSVFVLFASQAQLAVAQTPQLPVCQDGVIEHVLSVDQESGLLGNGGDALVRKDQAGQRNFAMLLDFYEGMQTSPRMSLDLGGPTLTVMEKVGFAISKLDRVDPLRAARYREWLQGFKQGEACFAAGIRLKDIDDSNHIQLPDGPGWEIEQVAIQKDPVFPEYPRYVINLDIWNEMDKDNQAGLILHELMYRDATQDGIHSSEKVRKIVMTVASEKLLDLSVRDYVERLSVVGIRSFSFRGAWLLIDEKLFFEDDMNIYSASAVKGSFYEFKWGKVRLRCTLNFPETGPPTKFHILLADAPILQVGTEEYQLTSNTADSASCDDKGRVDLHFDFPDTPDVGSTYITAVKNFYLNSLDRDYTYGSEFQFIGGILTYSNIKRDSWVLVNGFKCEIVVDSTIYFNIYPAIENVQIKTCSIPLSAAIVEIEGPIKVLDEGQGLKAETIILTKSQILRVHANSPNEAKFTGGLALKLWPHGSVKLGFVEKSFLTDSLGHGRFFHAAWVDFDENGYVITTQ